MSLPHTQFQFHGSSDQMTTGQPVVTRRLSTPSRWLLAIGVLLTSGCLGITSAAAQVAVPTTDVVVPTGGSTVPTDGSTTANPPITRPAPSETLPTDRDRTVPAPSTVPTDNVRFSCRTDNGRPTVMYQPESQPGQFFAWAVPQQMGGGWSPQRRCAEISRRLELYRPDGLVEMQTAVENGYNTVCVTTDKVPTCRIVFTVPQGQDPIATRNSVFENLAIADSGQRTQGVATYRDGQGNQILGQLGKALNIDLGGLFGRQSTRSLPAGRSTRNGIQLKPFLDPADGGTGQLLKRPTQRTSRVTPPRKGLRLRDVFR